VERASADKDAKKKEGWTPLHLAAREGRKKCVKLLLRAGAKKGATDFRGEPKLHLAAREGARSAWSCRYARAPTKTRRMSLA
jgi:cytohesin